MRGLGLVGGGVSGFSALELSCVECGRKPPSSLPTEAFMCEPQALCGTQSSVEKGEETAQGQWRNG